MKRSIGILVAAVMLFSVAGCGKMSAAGYYQDGCGDYEKGDYEEALADFQKALEKGLSGEYLVYSYSYMGHCYLKKEDSQSAEQYYQMALATGKEPAMCYTNLGVYYRKCGEYEQAEKYYLLALEADDSYPEALTSLGVLYSVTGQAEKALPLLEKAITLSGEPSGFHYANLSYAYAAAGRTAEAREQLLLAREKGYTLEDYAIILNYIEEKEAEGSGKEPDNGRQPGADVTQPPASVTPVPTGAPAASATPVPTGAPAASAAPVPTGVPEVSATPEPARKPALSSGRVIAIDPGHQKKSNYEQEPVGPGASEQKIKVSSGTQGVTTKVPEHQFNLELSLKLKDALEEAGYQVVMTRETAEVDLSNAERAGIANDAKADIFIRIHADGAENKAANGISVLYPSERNPYVAALSPESKKLAKSVLDGLCDATGANRRGIVERDDLTGTNWAKMPVIVVEAGFMTNEAEEKKLLSKEYQALLVQGIVEGVQEYFGE